MDHSMTASNKAVVYADLQVQKGAQGMTGDCHLATSYSSGGWYLPGFEEHFYLTTQNDFTMPASLSSPPSSSFSVRALGVMGHQRSSGNSASKTDTGSSFGLVGDHCKQFRKRFWWWKFKKFILFERQRSRRSVTRHHLDLEDVLLSTFVRV